MESRITAGSLSDIISLNTVIRRGFLKSVFEIIEKLDEGKFLHYLEMNTDTDFHLNGLLSIELKHVDRLFDLEDISKMLLEKRLYIAHFRSPEYPTPYIWSLRKGDKKVSGYYFGQGDLYEERGLLERRIGLPSTKIFNPLEN